MAIKPIIFASWGLRRGQANPVKIIEEHGPIILGGEMIEVRMEPGPGPGWFGVGWFEGKWFGPPGGQSG